MNTETQHIVYNEERDWSFLVIILTKENSQPKIFFFISFFLFVIVNIPFWKAKDLCMSLLMS